MKKGGVRWYEAERSTTWRCHYRGYALRLDRLSKHVWCVFECDDTPRSMPKRMLGSSTKARLAVLEARAAIDARYKHVEHEAPYLTFYPDTRAKKVA